MPPDLAELLDSWLLDLYAQRKAPGTVAAYGGGVRKFLRWCEKSEHVPTLDRATVTAWIVALLDAGNEASTVTARQLAVKRFSAWLALEGEIPRDDLVGIKPPKIDVPLVEPLTDDQCRALVKACTGINAFVDRRDEAIVRVMLECGLRAAETVAITTADVNLPGGTIRVVRGKGGKSRLVPIGPQTAKAVDRWLRVRRTHRLTREPQLWLGDGGKGFGYEGLHKALGKRAARAGIDGFYPHRLRHTFASRWQRAGGSEGSLMSIAGWSNTTMIRRYSAYTASERAAEEARRLNLGDI